MSEVYNDATAVWDDRTKVESKSPPRQAVEDVGLVKCAEPVVSPKHAQAQAEAPGKKRYNLRSNAPNGPVSPPEAQNTDNMFRTPGIPLKTACPLATDALGQHADGDNISESQKSLDCSSDEKEGAAPKKANPFV